MGYIKCRVCDLKIWNEVEKMDKEFLEDYETKEREKIKKFNQMLRDGKFRLGDRCPSEDSLELNEPYMKAISLNYQ